MPLMHFHLYEGRTEAEIKTLLDSAHQAMIEAFSVPERDRYQLVSEYKSTHMIMEDTGLDIPRSHKAVLVQMFSRPRELTALTSFYEGLVARLGVDCGIPPTDVMISVVENTDAHWSFGLGRAQFLTGELGTPTTKHSESI